MAYILNDTIDCCEKKIDTFISKLKTVKIKIFIAFLHALLDQKNILDQIDIFYHFIIQITFYKKAAEWRQKLNH